MLGLEANHLGVAIHQLGKVKVKQRPNALSPYKMVAQARVELATPASSGQRSTDELPGHSAMIQ